MFFSLPWHIPKSETIKLKSCRNLIDHYLGNILEKLTLEQLSVNLYNGTGTVSDVTLDCDVSGYCLFVFESKTAYIRQYHVYSVRYLNC